MQEFELIAKTFQGLEEVLAQELIELGANNVAIGRRMVSFTGNQEMMYRANFCLRTAIRILKPIKHFKASHADDVYEAVKSIEWSEYLDLTTSFSVDSVVFSEDFRHSKFVTYKVKDAIVDYFREKEGQRPNVSITKPDMKLNIHVAGNDCTLSLDSSGESLHQRGYRVFSVKAPLNEVLAAGMLKIAGWDGQSDFVDPFCGSGTIAIEAALMAKNIYPGIFRKEFGFEKWKDFDAALLDRIYNDDSQEREFEHHIYAYDLNQPTLDGAAENAKSASVADCITFERQDIRKFVQPEQPALMVTNPPYGERLVSNDLLSVYKALGERLKFQFKGNTAWVISSKKELFDNIALKPSTKAILHNGSLDCDYRKYILFDGSIKDFRREGGEVKNREDRRRNAEKRPSKFMREDFNSSLSGVDDIREDEDQAMFQLRSKHREFERQFGKRPRSFNRNDSDERRPARPRAKGERRQRIGKPFTGGRRKTNDFNDIDD